MRRMALAFLRPSDAFRGLSAEPWSWAAPAVLVCLLMSLAPQIVYDLHYQRQQVALDTLVDRGLLGAETARAARLRIADDAADRGPGRIAQQVTVSGVTALAFRFILPAALLLMGLRFALASRVGFSAVLGALSLAALPAGLREIVRTPLQYAKGSLDVYFGPAALAGHTRTPGAQALGLLDFFDLWVLALLIVGLAEVGQVSRGRAAALVLPLWLALALLRFGLKASPLGAAF